MMIACYILLGAALVLTGYRLFSGPTTADRILAVDLLAAITAAAVLVRAIRTDAPVFVDVVMVLGIIVFFGTVALARTLSKN